MSDKDDITHSQIDTSFIKKLHLTKVFDFVKDNQNGLILSLSLLVSGLFLGKIGYLCEVFP